MISEPSPKPKPPFSRVERLDRVVGVQDRDQDDRVEEVAVQVLHDQREPGLAVYFACGSRTAQAAGERQNAR